MDSGDSDAAASLRALEDYVIKSPAGKSSDASEIEIHEGKASSTDITSQMTENKPSEFNPKILDYAKEAWLDNPHFIDSVQGKVQSDPIAKGFREVLELMKELEKRENSLPPADSSTTDMPQGERSQVTSSQKGQPVFDWGSMFTLSSNVLDSYSDRIESIFNELNKVQRYIGYWQESGFSFDAHRGVQVVSHAEEWAKSKERFLKYRHDQLDTTVKEIRDTVSRLEKTDEG